MNLDKPPTKPLICAKDIRDIRRSSWSDALTSIYGRPGLERADAFFNIFVPSGHAFRPNANAGAGTSDWYWHFSKEFIEEVYWNSEFLKALWKITQ